PKVPIAAGAAPASGGRTGATPAPAPGGFARPASAGPTAEGTFALVVDVDTGGYDPSDSLPAAQLAAKVAEVKKAKEAKAAAAAGGGAAAGGAGAEAGAEEPKAKKAPLDPDAKKAAIEAARA